MLQQRNCTARRYHAAQLLIYFNVAFYTLQLVRSSPLTCGSKFFAESHRDAWSCTQARRIERLTPLLLAINSDSVRWGAMLQGYMDHRPQMTADELHAWKMFEYKAHDNPSGSPSQLQLRQMHQVETHMPAVPWYSSVRRLLQLSSSDKGGQLTTTSVQKTTFTSPDSSTHAVSDHYSALTTPLAADSLQLISLASDKSLGSLAHADQAVLTQLLAEAKHADTTPSPLPNGVTAFDQHVSSQTEGLQPSLRITGGVEAPTDRKYVCSLRASSSSSNNFLYCGCTIIAPSVVLTAAHCLAGGLRTPWVEIGRYYQQQANNTGTNNYDRIKCSAGVQHHAWSEVLSQNDIGLCFLEAPSRFAPVKLAQATTTKLTTGQALTAMGWGATTEGGSQSSALMTVDVTLSDLSSCSAAYDNIINGNTQICAGVPAGGKDACQGDSGGPLIIKGATADQDLQVGVVSFGIGCGRPSVPGVYTDVRAYRTWIAQQMLARGVSYMPITDGFTVESKANTEDQASACACTRNGTSGSTFVGAQLASCKQHGLSMGDDEFYCYAQGGVDCLAATKSSAYPGAAWIPCSPEVFKAQGPPGGSTPQQTAELQPTNIQLAKEAPASVPRNVFQRIAERISSP